MKKQLTINKQAVDLFIIELKLHINRNLYEKGLITEEMHTKAKEIILKG